MGAIRDSSSGAIRILEPSHVVGRGPAPKCSLTLNEPYVSGVHAELRWTGADWELKDLGSRNGTFLDGRRLDPSAPTRLEKGSKVAFGAPERTWELVDASPPPVMVVPLGGGEPVLLRDDFIALPSSDDPRATIYRTIGGRLECSNPADAGAPISSDLRDLRGRRPALAVLVRRLAARRRWPCRTTRQAAHRAARPAARRSRYRRDEEHVRLEMTRPGHDVDMGSRKHNYLLLTLARRRLNEEAQGLPRPRAAGSTRRSSRTIRR